MIRSAWLWLAASGPSLLVACTGTVGGNASPAAGGSSSTQPVQPAEPTGAPAKPNSVLVPTSRLARLSHWQWGLSVKDLLKLPDLGGLEEQVTKDAVVGFDNEVEALSVGQNLRDDLQTVSEVLAGRVVSDSAALARIVPSDLPMTLPDRARAFVTSFGLRAYRRPLESSEIDEAITLFNQGAALLPDKDAFQAGVELVVQFFLQSPYFLYRIELSTQAVSGNVLLSDYEVASKLSYALAGTMPDDALMAKAAAGALRTAEQVGAEVDRLLASQAAVASLEHFDFQLLKLGGYPGITKDAATYPRFTSQTASAMSQETTLFLDWIFSQNMGLKEALTRPVSFVNSALAPIYGLPEAFGSTFVQVDLDPSQRAGFLTQPGFLALNAHEKEIDSIHRGVFVLQRILCAQLAPPANVAIPPVPASDGVTTNRQRITALTGSGTCGAACHATTINPIGFAFEEYDGIGAFRTTDNGQPVDATGKIVVAGAEKDFTGAVEFSRALAEAPDVHSCYVANWMSYLFGRKVEATGRDAPMVTYLGYRSLTQGMSTKDMIRELASTDNFLKRLPEVP